MNRLNEKTIVKIFQDKLGNKKFIPEDVEFFKIGKKYVVVKVDTLVESTDMPYGTKLEDAARKSILSCVSDFAAKGVKPNFGIVSLTIPKRYSNTKIENLAAGFAKAAKEFHIKILGGDTNEGTELVISFSLFGITEKIVKRKGAKSNDIIITSGPFGYSSAGLSILLKNKKYSKRFDVKAKKAVFRPNCKLVFGLKNKNYFSSAMDSSDGLSTTLIEMSNQSKSKFIINKLPTEADVVNFANSNIDNFLSPVICKIPSMFSLNMSLIPYAKRSGFLKLDTIILEENFDLIVSIILIGLSIISFIDSFCADNGNVVKES